MPCLICEAHHELDLPAPCHAGCEPVISRVPIVASIDHVLVLVQVKLPLAQVLPATVETNQPNDDIAYRQKLNLCKNKTHFRHAGTHHSLSLLHTSFFITTSHHTTPHRTALRCRRCHRCCRCCSCYGCCSWTKTEKWE